MKRSWILLLLLAVSLSALAQREVRIGRYRFVPDQNIAPSAVRGAARRAPLALGGATLGRHNVLVQLDELPSQASHDALRAKGVELYASLGGNAYFASVPEGVTPEHFRGTQVVSVMPIRPEWRISELLAGESLPEWTVDAANPNLLKAMVYWQPNVDAQFVEDRLAQGGFTYAQVSPVFRSVRVALSRDRLAELAREPWIALIAPIDAPKEISNAEGRALSGGQRLGMPSELGGYGLTGKNVRIGVWDENVDLHADYGKRVTRVEFGMPVESGHGMHVSGTVAGSGLIDPRAQGVAPGALLWTSNFSTSSEGDTEATEALRLYDSERISLTQNSYGPNLSRLCRLLDRLSYSALGVDMRADILSYHYPDLTHVFAVGNDQQSCHKEYRTVAYRGKNLIYVGATTGVGRMANFSSWGPADDGRILPAITAKGDDVYSTMPSHEYDKMGGTSMACPMVTGHLALLTERYGQLNGGAVPQNVLLKGLVANTAEDKGTPGPDYCFGFGLLDARAAVRAMERSWYRFGEVVAGQELEPITINVPEGLKQVRFMLVWNDPVQVKEYAFGEKALVNDLDLTVSAGSASYLPWVLNPQDPSAEAQRGADDTNNIEQVTIDSPSAGQYTIRIGGHGKIASSEGVQPFLLTWYFEEEGAAILYPAGGEVFEPGERVLLKTVGLVAPAGIEVSFDGGESYRRVATGNPAAAYLRIPSDAPATTRALLRVTDAQGRIAVTPHPFTVMGTPQGVSLEASPCDVSGWKLRWEAVPGAVRYHILKANTDTEEYAPIGNTEGTEFSIDAAHISMEGRNIFSVQAEGASGIKGQRSVGVLAQGGVPLQLSMAKLPYHEYFTQTPLQHTVIAGGKSMMHTFVTNFMDDAHPFSYLLLALSRTDAEKWDDPFSMSDHVLKFTVCSVDLSGIDHGTKVVLMLHQALLFEDEAPYGYSTDAQMRLLVNGSPLANADGVSVLKGDNRMRRHVWDLSSYVGQRVTIEGQFASKQKTARWALAGFSIEQANPSVDVELVEVAPVESKPAMGTEKVRITLRNNGYDATPKVKAAVMLDGEEKAQIDIESLKGYEARDVEISVDFSTTNPDGKVFDMQVQLQLDGDVNPENNAIKQEVYNKGLTIPLDFSEVVDFMGIETVRDPKRVVTLSNGNTHSFTDHGGLLQSYPTGQVSSMKIKPSASDRRVRMEFRHWELTPGDTLFVYTTKVPDDGENIDARLGVSSLYAPSYALTGSSTEMMTFTSVADDGAITVRFVSEDVPAKGWKAMLTEVSSSTSKLEVKSVSSKRKCLDGMVPVTVEIDNTKRGATEQHNVLVRLLSKDDGGKMTLLHSVVIPKIEAKKTVSHTFPPINAPIPTRMQLVAEVQGSENAHSKDFTLYNDRYWTGDGFASEDYRLHRITVNGVEVNDLPEDTKALSYQLWNEVPLYTGTPNRIEFELPEEPSWGVFANAPALHIWMDADEADGTLADSGPEYLKVPLEKSKTEYAVTLDLHTLPDPKAGAKRLRFLLLPDDQLANFKADKQATKGYALDITANLSVGDSPRARDIRLAPIFGISNQSGFNVSNSQEIKLYVYNEGAEDVSNQSLELWLDGELRATETLNGPIAAWGGEQLFTFSQRLDLSAPGKHTIKVVAPMADDGAPENNTVTQEIHTFTTPNATTLYSVSLEDGKGERIEFGNSLSIGLDQNNPKFTLEGWFYFPESQVATLFQTKEMLMLTTASNASTGLSRVVIGLGGGHKALSKRECLRLREWNHVALAYEEKMKNDELVVTMHLYINGQEEALLRVGNSQSAFDDLQVGIESTVRVKGIRMWNDVLLGEQIAAQMFQSVRQSNGSLLWPCVAEFMMNEGSNDVLGSGTLFGTIVSGRVSSSTNPVWVTEGQLFRGTQLEGQLRQVRKSSDGAYEALMESSLPNIAALPGRILSYWPGTVVKYNGAVVQPSTTFNFDNPNHEITLTLEHTLFGFSFSETVKLRLLLPSQECSIAQLRMPVSENAGLQDEILLDGPQQTIRLNPTGEGLDVQRVTLLLTLSEKATARYNGVMVGADGRLTLNLHQPQSVEVIAENGVDRKFYTVQISRGQTIEWGDTPLTRSFSSQPLDLGVKASSGLPVRLYSKSNAIATIDGENRLVTVSLGTCEIVATQPGNGLYAQANPIARTVHVTPAQLVVRPVDIVVPVGDPIPDITLKASGLQFDEDIEEFVAAYPFAILDASGNVWDKTKPALPEGEYRIAAQGYTSPYSKGNYEVTLREGRLWVGVVPIRTVTFDTDGGSGDFPSLSVTHGESATKPASDPTREGYSFRHWSLNRCGDAYDFSSPVTENFSLYAVWTANSYTVAFDANGADGGSMEDQPFTYDAEQALRANAFTRSGCSFIGWNSQADGSGAAYADGALVKNLTAQNGATVTLYAQWRNESAAQVTFVVTADGQALPDARVTVSGVSPLLTDASGHAVLTLPLGNHQYTVEKEGFESVSGELEVTGDKTLEVSLKAKSVMPTAVSGSLLASVEVCPNPFGAVLTLANVGALRQLRVYTVDGQCVQTLTHDGAERLSIPTDGWSSGLYILYLVDSQGDVTRLHVVKQ